MNNNDGFQPFYPPNQGPGNQQYNPNPNGYNTQTFHRSNTYMPEMPVPVTHPILDKSSLDKSSLESSIAIFAAAMAY